MKVVIFSHQETAKRLVVWLREQGIDVTVISDRPSKMPELWEGSKFDLGIVDDLIEDAVVACHRIKKKWDIPLVLIVSKQYSDWKKVWLLNADGYLPGDAGDYEFTARLDALLRRLHLQKIARVQRGDNGTKPDKTDKHPVEQEPDDLSDLTVSEVAKILNIHVNTVRRWSDWGILPSHRSGRRQDRKFRQEDINTFLGIYNVIGPKEK
jgi:excisionase family DNA binding protein